MPAELKETNFNSTHVQEYKVPHFPFPVWRDESMHELLMQLARCVADVIREARDPAQPPGNVLRSLLRVDVVLTEHYGQVSCCSTSCLVCGMQHACKSALSCMHEIVCWAQYKICMLIARYSIYVH